MGRRSRDKGARREREIVQKHLALGVHAEKVSGMYLEGSDLDIYARGRENAPLVAEAKARASGAGFVTLERWLSSNDVLFLVRDRAEPLVVLPWRIWAEMLGGEFSPVREAADG